jgi:hypothetical protein
VLNLGFVTDVAAHGNGGAAVRMDRVADLLGRRDVPGIVDDHLITARSGKQRRRRADATAAAGDDEDALGH